MRYVFIVLALLTLSGNLSAQLSIHLGINIESQPMWGPAGYDRVEYYYLPDIEVYYNVPLHRFYYFDGGVWIWRSSLPYQYRDYDLYHSYKVVVNDRSPYRNHRMYKEKYSSFRGQRNQQPIRDSRDERYFSNKKHPEHNKWIQKKEGRGNSDKQQDNNRRRK